MIHLNHSENIVEFYDMLKFHGHNSQDFYGSQRLPSMVWQVLLTKPRAVRSHTAPLSATRKVLLLTSFCPFLPLTTRAHNDFLAFWHGLASDH